MLKKNIYITFILMLISIFLLTTIPTYANVELASHQNHTKKSKSKKHGHKSKSKKHGKKGSGQKKSLGHPKWVSYRYSIKRVRNKKEDNPDSINYYKFKIDITYTNNSKDKIIKSFFNRSISVSFDHCIKSPMAAGDIKYKGKYYDKISHCKTDVISYTKPVKCTIYPGESYTITYNIPFSKFNWKKKYNSKEHSLIRYKISSHKFQVQKENMNVE